MSIFKDNADVTAATWYSSPWSKYRFTPKRHVIEQASGSDHDMIWWIADDAWVGKKILDITRYRNAMGLYCNSS